MYKKTYYYYFESGKVVISPKSLSVIAVAALETKFGKWYYTIYK